MKKQLPAFLSGVVVTALIFTCAPAIAAQFQTITATLNSVNIEVNGQKVAVSGENYTLDNGKQTAGSIVFNETTYVPIRKFGEVMGAEIGYDGATGSVTVKGEVKAPETTPAPETPLPPDYSDWTAEEEQAYQEFKGMWEVETRFDGVTIYGETGVSYKGIYNGNLTEEAFSAYLDRLGDESAKKYVGRMVMELYRGGGTISIDLGSFGKSHGITWFREDQNSPISPSFNH